MSSKSSNVKQMVSGQMNTSLTDNPLDLQGNYSYNSSSDSIEQFNGNLSTKDGSYVGNFGFSEMNGNISYNVNLPKQYEGDAQPLVEDAVKYIHQNKGQ